MACSDEFKQWRFLWSDHSQSLRASEKSMETTLSLQNLTESENKAQSLYQRLVKKAKGYYNRLIKGLFWLLGSKLSNMTFDYVERHFHPIRCPETVALRDFIRVVSTILSRSRELMLGMHRKYSEGGRGTDSNSPNCERGAVPLEIWLEKRCLHSEDARSTIGTWSSSTSMNTSRRLEIICSYWWLLTKASLLWSGTLAFYKYSIYIKRQLAVTVCVANTQCASTLIRRPFRQFAKPK